MTLFCQNSITNQKYGLKAEDTFWVQQGIFWAASLRSSQDEEMIADIAASILFGSPFNKSLEELDDLYDPDKELYRKVENALAVYGAERLSFEIKSTFSVIKETIISFSKEPNALRKVISGIRNELITPFYAIFMAFFDLVVRQEMSPTDTNKIMNAIKGLSKDMVRSRHYTTAPDREKNIHKTIGLIQPFFAKKEPPVLQHGPGLSLDFENSLRRSRIETSRYEFKQGILQLDTERKIDEGVFVQIINTICGIANIGPDAGGYIFVGVAGKSQDAKRISQIDNIFPYDVNEPSIVGVDRELTHINCSMEQYMNKFLDKIRFSKLSEPLKTQVLSHVDIVQYRGFHVIRIVIPAQKQPSSIGEKVYLREGANTIEATPQKAMALSHLFNKGTN
jgi:hypothetical protein